MSLTVNQIIGERLHAALRLVDGANLTAHSVLDWCRQHVGKTVQLPRWIMLGQGLVLSS